MFRQVFDPENLFWRLISRGVDFVGLSLFWIALCLPVVTIGPATAALYYTVVKVFRHKGDGAFGMYWRSFVQNLRRGIPATLIFLPVMALLVYGYLVMAANVGPGMRWGWGACSAPPCCWPCATCPPPWSSCC